MEADDFLCSRNARPKKALVGRAQWKINQPPSLRDNERAAREHWYLDSRQTAKILLLCVLNELTRLLAISSLSSFHSPSPARA
jgi:hypothetical protein